MDYEPLIEILNLPQSPIAAVTTLRRRIADDPTYDALGIIEETIQGRMKTGVKLRDDLVASYFVQNMMQDLIEDEVMLKSQRQGEEMYLRVTEGDMKYVTAKPDDEVDAATQLAVAKITKQKPKKGAKKIRAKELLAGVADVPNAEKIELLMKELDMSKAGARTYVYNYSKGVW